MVKKIGRKLAGWAGESLPEINRVPRPRKIIAISSRHERQAIHEHCHHQRRNANQVLKNLKERQIMLLIAYTILHVIISLVGIFSGFVVLSGLIAGRRLDGWTALFLATTVATSVTGFFFPVHHFMPSHVVGIISLVVLGVAIYARYSRCLTGAWRKVYVVCAVLALYLNVFVAIVQAFLKLPALNALAPTQTEPPFKLTQLVVLGLFVVLAIVAAIRFRSASALANPT
jgi:hypothetical protein